MHILKQTLKSCFMSPDLTQLYIQHAAFGKYAQGEGLGGRGRGMGIDEKGGGAV